MRHYDARSQIEKVRDVRERYECGLQEARAIVEREDLRNEISRIEDMNDVRRVLLMAFPSKGEV